MTTTVDLVIRLQVVGSPADVARHRAALECLAEVMAAQAEDGLWSLGHAEAETDGPSEYVADINNAVVHAVLIDGNEAKEKSWTGMCLAGKHGLDFAGQPCDLCAGGRLVTGKIDHAAAPASAVLCPNCETDRHARCCSWCGTIHKPRRLHHEHCSAACDRAAAEADRFSAALEEEQS